MEAWIRDEQANEELSAKLKAHHKMLRMARAAKKLGRPNAAREICQQVLLRMAPVSSSYGK